MNRPKIDDYVEFEQLTEKGAYNFVTDLISYCDKLERALDRACEDIATYVIRDVDKCEIVYMQLQILKEKYKSEYLSESEKE